MNSGTLNKDITLATGCPIYWHPSLVQLCLMAFHVSDFVLWPKLMIKYHIHRNSNCTFEDTTC
ncbi:hypothetical protein BGX31_000915, partial [Mortierella sp. GBA43]